MKRLLGVGLALWLILWGGQATSAAPPLQEPETQYKDEPSSIGIAGIIPAPKVDDTHFVANTGPYLDRYLFRNDVPNGRLTFEIPITRYYSPLIKPSSVDNKGFLKANVREKLIKAKILPKTAHLRLHVFDVDEDVPAPNCAEVDYIYVNGQPVLQNGSRAKLSGANDTWSSPSFVIPIDVLKFPTAKGQNGQPPRPKANQIAIEIDVFCSTLWAVEVDWGVLEIATPVRPIVFAHGWVGDNHTFDAFETLAKADGLPTAKQPSLQRGIRPIAQTSPRLVAALSEAAVEFGVDKVNIFGHSKGGLVSRHALRNPQVAGKIDNLITFGSPHHGTDWMYLAATVMCREFPQGTERDRCNNAAMELTVDDIRDNFNYQGCTKGPWPWSKWTGCKPRYVRQPNVDYRSIVGGVADVRAKSATYPWRADAVPYPDNGSVDAQYNSLSHLNIHTKPATYCRALGYLSGNIQTKTCSGITPTGLTPAVIGTTPVFPDEQYQTTFEKSGNLTAGSNTTLSATSDGTGQILFNVFTAKKLDSFTLRRPNGSTVTPSTSGVTYVAQKLDEAGWWYQYSVDTPAAGTWQLRLKALNATSYSSNVMVKSNIKLYVKTNKQTYNHNETVKVEAALANKTAPLLGSTISLLVTRPNDTTLSASLVDNGTNGDTKANDGVYTARFNSSTISGQHQLSVSAAKGQTKRVVKAFIAVTSKTADIQSVTSVSPIDTNSNSLYDELRFNVSLKVLAAGHFEVTGTLVGPNGTPVAATSYGTLLAGSAPLSIGTHTIPLTFRGSTIRERGVNGPYTLTDVVVVDQSEASLQVDSAKNLHTTSAYQANQFEGPLLTLNKGNETAIDNNGNGRYDILRINLGLKVINPGTYRFNGRLVDSKGDEIGWSSGSFVATGSGSFSARLEFDGKLIYEHGVKGPYTVQDLSVFNSTGIGSEIFNQAYTTQAYNHTQFEFTSQKTYLPFILKKPGSQPQPGPGFNSQFNGSASGWKANSGVWNVNSSFYSTNGTSIANTWSSASYNAEFADFDYRAKLWRTGCNCAARLLIRGTPDPMDSSRDWYSFYSFNYTQGGYYSVWKRVNGGAPIALQSWAYSSAIATGNAWNTVRVVAYGPQLSLYFNDKLVWTGNDSALTSGRVGISMYQDSSTGNQLRADWATLTTLGATETELLTVEAISAEQQALNETANQHPGQDATQPPQ